MRWLIPLVLLVSACAKPAAPPEPLTITREVKIPVSAPCPAQVPAQPAYPDTDEARKAAPDIYVAVQLLVAGKVLREAEIQALRKALAICTGFPSSPF